MNNSCESFDSDSFEKDYKSNETVMGPVDGGGGGNGTLDSDVGGSEERYEDKDGMELTDKDILFWLGPNTNTPDTARIPSVTWERIEIRYTTIPLPPPLPSPSLSTSPSPSPSPSCESERTGRGY